MNKFIKIESSKSFIIYKRIALVLTAFVPLSHGSDDKKYVATGRRITDAREEQKRSRYEQSSLLIKDFKYGSSLSIFVLKNNKAQRSNISQISH